MKKPETGFFKFKQTARLSIYLICCIFGNSIHQTKHNILF